MKITDLWLRDLPQQFQEKKNIEVLIKAFSKQLEEIERVFFDINSKTNIINAVGTNLDMLGSIVSLSRKEAAELLNVSIEDITDERYRNILKYKILNDTNECTYNDLINGLKLLYGDDIIKYFEFKDNPANIFLEIQNKDLMNEELEIGAIPVIKPSGVQVHFRYPVIFNPIEVGFNYIYGEAKVPICGVYQCGQWPQ